MPFADQEESAQCTQHHFIYQLLCRLGSDTEVGCLFLSLNFFLGDLMAIIFKALWFTAPQT